MKIIPTTETYMGKPAKLQLTKDNGGITFKTRITEAAQNKACGIEYLEMQKDKFKGWHR